MWRVRTIENEREREREREYLECFLQCLVRGIDEAGQMRYLSQLLSKHHQKVGKGHIGLTLTTPTPKLDQLLTVIEQVKHV